MTKHDRSDEKVCETSPCRQAPCRRLLVCCPENHLPSINWETKLGKQLFAFRNAPQEWAGLVMPVPRQPSNDGLPKTRRRRPTKRGYFF